MEKVIILADGAEDRAKEQELAAKPAPVKAIHIGWDYLDSGQMVATYAVPVKAQIAPDLYTAPLLAQSAAPLTRNEFRVIRNKLCNTESGAEWDLALNKSVNELLVSRAQAQPAAPLTDEQINLFINGRGDEGDENYVEPTGDDFGLTNEDLVKLIRRVEAAHGITKGQP